MTNFWEVIRKDRVRYSSHTGAMAFIRLLFNPCFRFVFVMRLCKASRSWSPHGMFFRLWFRRIKRKYGFQIPHTTIIGEGIFFSHYGNIVINPKSTIGKNCNIAQGVTIGQINTGEKKGCPVIGDRVWIGANAVVVGNVKIGDDVLIAPLAFVNFDVPNNSLVIGNPARIIPDKGSAGYVNNLHEG